MTRVDSSVPGMHHDQSPILTWVISKECILSSSVDKPTYTCTLHPSAKLNAFLFEVLIDKMTYTCGLVCMHIRMPSSTPMAKQSKLGSTFAALILIKVNTFSSCTKSALFSLNKSVEAGSHVQL